MGQILTLTGYLGKDPQIRTTQPRTLSRTYCRTERFYFEHAGRRSYDDYDVVEDRAEVEFTTTPRTFAVLSLATHEWKAGKRTTTWHRIVAWSIDDLHFGIRRLGKGDRVELTGHETSFKTADGREIQQIELVSFRLVSRKLRPEIPALVAPRPKSTPRPATSFYTTADGRSIPLAGEPIALHPASA